MSTPTSSSSLTSTATSSSASKSSFLASQTFSDPSFSVTSQAPTPSITGGGDGGNGLSNPPSIASSASLYLYTFLATLVLLLSVSAAIVVRSFILRRRHRRMIDEAMRNGTWMPPSPGGPGSRAVRVDLSKKPVMWEAHLGGGWGGFDSTGSRKESAHPEGGTEKDSLAGMSAGMMHLNAPEKDWDAIKPVSAAYVIPSSYPAQLSTPQPIPLPTNADIQTPSTQPTEPRPRPTARLRAAARNVVRDIAQILSPTPAAPLSPLPAPPQQQQQNNSSSHLPLTFSGDAPPKMRVAVLIAMPSPPLSSGDDKDEDPLPLLEMGLAELLVVRHNSSSQEGDPLGAIGAQTGKKSTGSRDSASLDG